MTNKNAKKESFLDERLRQVTSQDGHRQKHPDCHPLHYDEDNDNDDDNFIVVYDDDDDNDDDANQSSVFCIGVNVNAKWGGEEPTPIIPSLHWRF